MFAVIKTKDNIIHRRKMYSVYENVPEVFNINNRFSSEPQNIIREK